VSDVRRPALALLLGCLLLVAGVSALDGYDYYQTIEYAGCDQDIYQQDIVIHRSTGTAYNETAGGLETWHIFVGEHCREDYGDIRFTNSTGAELTYYLWPDYSSSSARFAVRLAGADAAGTLVIWYGNPTATTTSDGDATYFHHDHFDADRSSEYSTFGTVYWNTAESRLEIGSASAAAYITPTASKYRDARIEARVMTRSTVTEPWTAPILLARWNNYLPGRSRYTCGFYDGSSGPNAHHFARMVDQTQTNLQYTPCELIRDTYYHYAFAVAGINPTHLLAYKDSQLVSSYTDANDLETSDYVGFQANTGEFYIDWILVRAYSAAPPAATTFSGEQETAFPGIPNKPRDLAGNGLYTDINGNNRLDYNDLTIFFQNLAWAKTAQPIACFDFNGNGWLDYNDVITLFSTITEEHT